MYPNDPETATLPNTMGPIPRLIVPAYGGDPILGFADGTMLESVHVSPPAPQSGEDFHANLALTLPPQVVSAIGTELHQAILRDIDSQKPWMDAVAKAVSALGIEPGDLADESRTPQFEGATSVTSVAMFDNLLHVAALLRKHLYKAYDMVDTEIEGATDETINDTADRIKNYLNYYLTMLAPEFRSEGLRKDLWATVAGSAAKKVYIDPELGRVVSNFIDIEDFIINRSYSSVHAAKRKTQRLTMTPEEFEYRVRVGIYRDDNATSVPDMGSESELARSIDRVTGAAPANDGSQMTYRVLECHTSLFVDGDPYTAEHPLPAPYIVALDEESGAVLSIHRNWSEQDINFAERKYFVVTSLFPSLHGQGYGLVNYATRLSDAATMLTQQFINSAVLSNFPGGFVRGGLRNDKKTYVLKPMTYEEIIVPSEKLADSISTIPVAQPGPALFESIKQMEDNIRRPFMVMSEKVSDLAMRASEGTTLFLMDQLHQVPNALLQSFYQGLSEELTLIRERIAEWLPANRPYPFMANGKENVIMKEDFAAAVRIVPSADPSLPSSSYRMLQAELVLKTSQMFPQLHNAHNVLKLYYDSVGLSPVEIAEVLPDPEETPPPQPLAPVEENSNILNGLPAVVGIDQDHAAHEVVHSVLYTHPDPNIAAAAQAHGRAHQAAAFVVQVYTEAGMPIPPDTAQIPIQIQNQIAQRCAAVVEQHRQQTQAPGLSPLDVKMAELQASKEKAQLEAQGRMAELELERERLRIQTDINRETLREKETANIARIQLEQLKFEHERALKEFELRLKDHELRLKAHEEQRNAEARALGTLQTTNQ